MTIWLRALWTFFTFGFLGWCTEVVYAAANHGRFINRGFLNGPICPIYGLGVFAVVEILNPIADHLILLFLGSVFVTTLLEFLTGWILDLIFHEKWWDYSKMPFNIKGYVCLKFSLIWGLSCTGVVRLVYPLLMGLCEKIPKRLSLVLLLFFGCVFLTDLVLTVIELAKLPPRFKLLAELDGMLNGVSENIGEGLFRATEAVKEKGGEIREEVAEKTEENRARIEELKEKLAKTNLIHRRLLGAFPQLHGGRYRDLLDKIRKNKKS